ncbi:MAG: hypothetical protein IPG04_30230 [Polyangiaceae bacterium]|jgi:hypothetical protein|nr:hypothetical protein [Polyangiaceae bacterium]
MTAREERVFGELVLTTLAPLDDDLIARLSPAVTKAAAELAPSWVPAGLLVDLCLLLVGPTPRLDLAALRAKDGLPVHDPALRRAISGAFEAILAPLAASPALSEVRDALLRHPKEIATEAAAVLAAEIAARLSSTRAADVGALAALRRALEHPTAEIVSAGTLALLSADSAADLARRYAELTARARTSGALIGPADVVVAQAAPHLRRMAARLALRQLGEAEGQLRRLIPGGVRRRRSRAADETTREHDEGTYPMGGFSSMTNAGSLENVVTSELALADDGDISQDLFTVRWATGELLYYTRDESLAHRRRISIWVLLSPELSLRGRVKDPGAPFQRIVLALAATSVLAARASDLLRREALDINVCCGGAELGEERALLALRLSDLMTRGVVTLHDVGAQGAAEPIADDRRASDVLVIELGADLGLPDAISVPDLEGGVERWAERVGAWLAALP